MRNKLYYLRTIAELGECTARQVADRFGLVGRSRGYVTVQMHTLVRKGLAAQSYQGPREEESFTLSDKGRSVLDEEVGRDGE